MSNKRGSHEGSRLCIVWQDMKQKNSKSNCLLHWKYILNSLFLFILRWSHSVFKLSGCLTPPWVQSNSASWACTGPHAPNKRGSHSWIITLSWPSWRYTAPSPCLCMHAKWGMSSNPGIKCLFGPFKHCLNRRFSGPDHRAVPLNMFRLNTCLNGNLRLDAICLNKCHIDSYSAWLFWLSPTLLAGPNSIPTYHHPRTLSSAIRLENLHPAPLQFCHLHDNGPPP
jgi:hypothetical protein